jgi:L-cysteine desulfidase
MISIEKICIIIVATDSMQEVDREIIEITAYPALFSYIIIYK